MHPLPHRRFPMVWATTVAVFLAAAAQAQGLRSERNIGLALANEAALAAVESCLKGGYNVSATVVERSGQVKALARGDGSGPHTGDASRRKAYTALTMRNNTATVGENWQKNPAQQNLVYLDDVLAVGGGLPIRAGNEVVGAIGVAGAPAGHLDDACAQAGIDKIKDRTN